MKQEQRLVAEVYRYIAPFVDTTKELYISLDGQAARTGLKKGLFEHATVPDLWFTLIGFQSPTLIEVKTVQKGKVMLMRSQLDAWRSDGIGAHRPQAWIAVNTEFDRFYFWSHQAFLPLLDRTRATTKTLVRLMPSERNEFKRPDELALHIIRSSPGRSSA